MTQEELDQTLIHGVEIGEFIALESKTGEAAFYKPEHLPPEAKEQALTAEQLREDLIHSRAAPWN